MGRLDYYRQFAEMTDEEVTAQLREQAEERRRRALARIEALDLSHTTWHEPPHPAVVNVVTFRAPGAVAATCGAGVYQNGARSPRRGRAACRPPRGPGLCGAGCAAATASIPSG